MAAQMTKTQLLAELRSARAEWDELLAQVGEARLTEPGAVGDWSVKDVIAHLTSYNRWFVNASEAYFRGQPPPLDGSEGLTFEARNQFYHQQTQAQPLAEVLEQSHQVFQRLLAMVERHSEEFLTQPQQFEGAPGPIVIGELLKGDCYDHYRGHAQTIRTWLEKLGAGRGKTPPSKTY